MKTVRHLARASGSTHSADPPYRIDIRVGGHRLVGDEPEALGGCDTGPSPFGLLASSLVACTATTLRMYAERKGWELATIDVDVRYDLDGDGRGSFTRTINVPADLPTEHVDTLEGVAERTPVTVILRAGTPITTTIRSEEAP